MGIHALHSWQSANHEIALDISPGSGAYNGNCSTKVKISVLFINITLQVTQQWC